MRNIPAQRLMVETAKENPRILNEPEPVVWITAFGERAVWTFKPTREGNTVVLAQRTPERPKRAALEAQADVIEARWSLPARKWLKVFKALEK